MTNDLSNAPEGCGKSSAAMSDSVLSTCWRLGSMSSWTESRGREPNRNLTQPSKAESVSSARGFMREASEPRSSAYLQESFVWQANQLAGPRQGSQSPVPLSSSLPDFVHRSHAEKTSSLKITSRSTARRSIDDHAPYSPLAQDQTASHARERTDV